MREISDEIVNTIGYAVGLDITDPTAKNYLKHLIGACQDDLVLSGVKEDNLSPNNKLLTSTYIIFVSDNLNSKPGEYKTSPMYISNADKLRSKIYKVGKNND